MAGLRLVAGLGNPGKEYERTRHNVGFMVLDRLAAEKQLVFAGARDWHCEWVRWDDTWLVKPLTYMNRSGESVGPLTRYLKIEPHQVLVVVDDVALPLGRLRLRSSGSDGGHNGLKSVIAHLGPEFGRLRVGVGAAGHPEGLIDHVLGKFLNEEKTLTEETIVRATAAIEAVRSEGMEPAMNQFNRAN